MKFNKSGQLILASAASLLAASLVTACGTLTVDFVFVTSAKAAGTYSYGEINVFEINSESGYMRQIPSSPFPSGGRNPVAEVLSTDNSTLYVANHDDNTIVQFTIGNDGKLYPQNTSNTPGTYPVSLATTSSYLFVADTYQPLASCSTASPCSGSIGVFALSSHALSSIVANGTQTSWPLALSGSSDIIKPVAITVSGSYLYVAAYDTTASKGYVFAYSIGSTGALTAVSGSPFAAGVQPSGLAIDPANKYLYVTDTSAAKVYSFAVSSGVLTSVASTATGNQPSAVVVDSTSSYVYVTNAQDGNLMSYSTSSGTLTRVGTYATGLTPVAVGIDPSKHQFLYTVNYQGSNLSGFELSSGGTLVNSQNTPYGTNAEPTAAVAVPHK